MRLPDQFLEEVRNAASIVDVVSAYVPLKKAGSSYKGLCPFHSEKTPSFNVNEQRGVFKCFGCGAGGDVFRFVMQYESLSFPDAIRRVAGHCGIPVPEAERTPADDRRARLRAINERALELFRQTLASAQGKAAREYLAERGVSDAAVREFELGLTPSGWEGLSRALSRDRYRAADIVAAGLAKERSGGRGIYDRFHDRLIFPIRDGSGRAVGFGGRTLTGHEPKYLNSPETELYRKSEVLYGFHLAKDAIRKTGEAVLVEGYLDVIAVHEAGIPQVVASLGTSLTSSHAQMLKRFARKVYLLYDGDAAGRQAAKRALKVLLPTSLQVAVVEVDGGQDPDDLVRSEGPEALAACISRARGFMPFLLADALPDGADVVEDRVRAVNEVLPFVRLVDDPVERAAHTARLAEAAGVDESAVVEALRRPSGERGGPRLAAPVEAPAEVSWSEAEGVLLMALLNPDGDARVQLLAELDEADWAGLPTERLFAAVVAAGDAGPGSVAALLAELDDDRSRELLSGVAMRHPDVSLVQGTSALQSLRQGRLRRELRTLQKKIADAGADEVDSLLRQKQELSRLLDMLGA